jgi:hypothetical protein
MLCRGLITILLICLLAGGLSPGAQAQGSDELATLNAQVKKLYGEGKYAEATDTISNLIATNAIDFPYSFDFLLFMPTHIKPLLCTRLECLESA